MHRYLVALALVACSPSVDSSPAPPLKGAPNTAGAGGAGGASAGPGGASTTSSTGTQGGAFTFCQAKDWGCCEPDPSCSIPSVGPCERAVLCGQEICTVKPTSGPCRGQEGVCDGHGVCMPPGYDGMYHGGGGTGGS